MWTRAGSGFSISMLEKLNLLEILGATDVKMDGSAPEQKSSFKTNGVAILFIIGLSLSHYLNC